MSENNIFNNYITKCPKCSGELSPGDFLCPYCGYDLRELNKEYEDGEQQVLDAMNRVNKAKLNLQHAEQYAKQNSYKKSSSRKWLIAIIVAISILLSIFMMAALVTFSTIRTDNKVEAKKNELSNQLVELIVMDNLEGLENETYKDTAHKSIAGCAQENENTLKIPLVEKAYDSEAIFSTDIYLEKFKYESLEFYDESSVGIRTEDFYITIDLYDGDYYKRPIDLVFIYEDNMNESERLENVKIGDIEFECYLVDDEIQMVASPKPNLFISYTFRSYDYERELKDFSIDEWLFLQHINSEIN